MLRLRSILLLTSAALTSSVVARAGDVPAAIALFKEARVEARAGKHTTACPKFRESYALDPAVGTLLNVADCDERDGHLLAARKHFQEGLGRLGSSDTRASYVRSRLRGLDEKIPQITGTLEPGMQLVVDGKDIAVTSAVVAVPVDPGPHQVQVRKSGREGGVALTLAASEKKAVDFPSLLPPPHPPVEPPAAPAIAANPPAGHPTDDARILEASGSLGNTDSWARRVQRAELRREREEAKRPLPLNRFRPERDRRADQNRGRPRRQSADER